MRPEALRTLLLIALAALPTPLGAQSSRTPGAVEAGLILRQLDGVKRVLVVAAHPDDEDTALMAALARGWGAEVAYFALTRGEGGQNLIGPELGEGLGIVRTGELLAARGIDGAVQRFSRAYDFGYSKTAEETFRQWPREELVRDLVWAIRSFRPQVLVSIFSGTPRDGHGQHQAAGLAALDAWAAAGDPARFPGQLEAGLEPWTPVKLYRRTYFDPENATLAMPTGNLDPLLGRSHHQIAMEARSRHRSQDFGTAQAPGPRDTHLALLETRVPSGPDDPILTGVDTTLATLARDLGEEGRPLVAGYRESVARARGSLAVERPAGAFPALAAARRSLDSLIDLPGARSGELGRELERRRRLLDRALLAAAGTRVELRSRDDVLVPGQEVLVEARVWSGRGATVTLDAPGIRAPAGWEVAPLAPDVTTDEEDEGGFGRLFRPRETLADPAATAAVDPGTVALWRYEVRVPADEPPSQPYFLERPRDGALYRWPENADVRTRPFGAPLLEAAVEATLALDGVETRIAVREEVRYRGVDKAAGEFWRPLAVAPRVSVEPEAGLWVWPVDDTRPREVVFRLLGRDPGGVSGTLALEVPDGWRAEPAAGNFALAGDGSEIRLRFIVSPPESPAEGEFALRPIVEAGAARGEGVSIRIIDYPHIEPRLVSSPATIRVVRLPVQVAERRVGYVMGSGDDGPEATRQLGLDVTPLEPGELEGARLDRFDTIVLGVRAYEVRPDLRAANGSLLAWVERGGTLVVQYNKYEFNDGDYAPYPLRIDAPAPRVTDETAPVALLDPEAAPVSWPNRIRPSDFDGWVQERGLYFPSEWGEPYRPLLSMADPGEEPRLGSLLVAPYGDGLYVHTSLSFFRQLPAGVPGAYRLWANLLSVDGERWRRSVADVRAGGR